MFLGKLQIGWDDVETTLKNNAKLKADQELYLHADKSSALRRRRQGHGGRQAGRRRQAGHGDRPAGVRRDGRQGSETGIRRGSRRSFAGLLITIALHGGVRRWRSRSRTARRTAPIIVPRDFVRAEMVKLGKPREKFWLPRIVAAAAAAAPPDAIKVRRIPNAKPAPARRRARRIRRSRRT